MGVSIYRKRKRRPALRPFDRDVLGRRCERCGGSRVGVESPAGYGSPLCSWCEHMPYKAEND